MYDVVMLITYLCVIAYLVYLIVIIFIKKSPLLSEKPIIRRLGVSIKLRASRILFLFKILRTILFKPIALLPIIALILFMLISAKAAIPTYTWYKVSDEGFNKTIIAISFNNPISINESEEIVKVLVRKVFNPTNMSVNFVLPIARITLTEPVTLSDVNRSIYIIVALPEDYIVKLKGELGLRLDAPYLLSCDETLRGNCIAPNKLLSLVVVHDIPLLPIQGYIGLKPILPPPSNVMITSLNYLPKILSGNVRKEVITDLVIVSEPTYVTNEYLESTKRLLLMTLDAYHTIGKVELICPIGKFIYSRIAIPTPKSVLVATTTSVISIVVLLAVLHALTPEVRNLYERLLIVGMPQWSMTVISSLYISLWMLMVGIPTLTFIYLRYGGLPTFNSFITLSITWLSSLIYMNTSLKPRSLTKTDVYVPVTRRYDLILSDGVELSKLESVIEHSLRTNEFFTIEELESQHYVGEVVIHARLMYNEVWGSGLDLNIVLTRDEGGVKIHISSYVWGIEEVSESIMNTMLSLAISRIVGAIRSCLT